MNPVEIVKPDTVAAALAAFRASDEAMFLSGGMTLVPSMKAHLAAPERLIDLTGIAEMTGIEDRGASLRVGALTRLADMANSPVVAVAVPELRRMAGMIADRHVRNRGTIGGSVANNDPAADYPAAVLGCGATLITDRREIAADDYFTGLFETALEDDEILIAIDLPKPMSAGYAKHFHPASGYAVAGVFVAHFDVGWRVAVTGSGSEGVFRFTDLELALANHSSETALAAIDVSKLDVIDEPAFPVAFRRDAIRWLALEAIARCQET